MKINQQKNAYLAQTVERWPFKPMVVGSIPTVGGSFFYIFLWVYFCSKNVVPNIFTRKIEFQKMNKK